MLWEKRRSSIRIGKMKIEDEEDESLLTREKREKLYASVPLERGTVDEIRKYCDAAVRLYGLISLEDMLALYNSQNPPIDEKVFMIAVEAIQKDKLAKDSFYIEDEPGVKPDKEHPARSQLLAPFAMLFTDVPEAGIRKLRRQQRGKPMKILSKKEFLKYANEDYFLESPEREAMYRYLLKTTNISPKGVEYDCRGIMQRMMENDWMKDVLEWTEWDEYEETEEWDIDEFMRFFKALNDVVPKHSNNGYSQKEMREIQTVGKNH